MSATQPTRVGAAHPPSPSDTSGLAGGLAAELVRLSRSTHALKLRFTQEAPPGVDWSSLVLLYHLVWRGPQRLGALASCVHVDPSTASRQAAQLVKAGLAERRADPIDGRASVLVATEAGRHLNEVREALRDRVIAELLEDWPESDVRLLTGLLHRLNQTVEASTGLDPNDPRTFDAAVPHEEN